MTPPPVLCSLAQGGLRILLVLLLVQCSTAQTCDNNRNSCANSIANCSNTLNSCGAGTYSFGGCSSTTKYQCICCPTGSNSTVGTTSITGCTCNAGLGGNSVTGSPTCCTACAAGTYKVASGNTACTPCPAYATTASTGSNTISACTCNAGYGGYANTSAGCTACAPGFYKHLAGNHACTACPTNSNNLPGQTSPTSCSCNTGYGGNALAGGCHPKGTTTGADFLTIILVFAGIGCELIKWYNVRQWSERRKKEYRVVGECCGCPAKVPLFGCVLWYDYSAAEKYDFKYNFSTCFVLIILSILKGTVKNMSPTDAALVNAIITMSAFPFELYDEYLLHFQSQDDESEIITTRRVLGSKVFSILSSFGSLVYETVQSASWSDGLVIGCVAVAFFLNLVVLCLQTYTFCHTSVRIPQQQQQQMGQFIFLSFPFAHSLAHTVDSLSLSPLFQAVHILLLRSQVLVRLRPSPSSLRMFCTYDTYSDARLTQSSALFPSDPLSGNLGFGSAAVRVHGCPAPARPQYNVPQQHQMGHWGPADPRVYVGGTRPLPSGLMSHSLVPSHVQTGCTCYTYSDARLTQPSSLFLSDLCQEISDLGPRRSGSTVVQRPPVRSTIFRNNSRWVMGDLRVRGCTFVGPVPFRQV
jgi:hypothetical protein